MMVDGIRVSFLKDGKPRITAKTLTGAGRDGGVAWVCPPGTLGTYRYVDRAGVFQISPAIAALSRLTGPFRASGDGR